MGEEVVGTGWLISIQSIVSILSIVSIVSRKSRLSSPMKRRMQIPQFHGKGIFEMMDDGGLRRID